MNSGRRKQRERGERAINEEVVSELPNHPHQDATEEEVDQPAWEVGVEETKHLAQPDVGEAEEKVEEAAVLQEVEQEENVKGHEEEAGVVIVGNE